MNVCVELPNCRLHTCVRSTIVILKKNKKKHIFKFIYFEKQAAGRHQCSYLIQQQMSEFLSVGGDERWLDGLHSIPAKLRDLYEINKILAHRPWLITKQHIEVCFHFFFYCVVYDICGGFQLFPCIHLEAVGNLFETYPINQFS